MVDQHPDALKLQAEAALKRLEEARLHERCPKACKSCSQKHRKVRDMVQSSRRHGSHCVRLLVPVQERSLPEVRFMRQERQRM